jgi:dihydrofolate reductase
MARVVVHATISLDGFIARPDDDISWAFDYGTDETVTDVMKEIGAVVVGNRGFREGKMTNETLPYGGMARVPQFVVTHKPRDPETYGGLTFTFVEGIERTIEQARAAAGDKSVMLLGASIGQQCLKAGLVDEILIHLVPVLIGEGIRLFDNLGAEDIRLERIQAVATAQVTSLRFRVIK